MIGLRRDAPFRARKDARFRPAGEGGRPDPSRVAAP